MNLYLNILNMGHFLCRDLEVTASPCVKSDPFNNPFSLPPLVDKPSPLYHMRASDVPNTIIITTI